jgi:hypothetical protein
VSPWIKKKPKSHLGIPKGGKRPKESSFFLGEIERLRESKRREVSIFFSEEGFAAKKRHDFQGKSWARISRQPTVLINPYGTDLVQPQLMFLFRPFSSTFSKAKGNI